MPCSGIGKRNRQVLVKYAEVGFPFPFGKLQNILIGYCRRRRSESEQWTTVEAFLRIDRMGEGQWCKCRRNSSLRIS